MEARMKRVIGTGCVVAMLSFVAAAYAQTTEQSTTQPASQAGSQRMDQGRQSGDMSKTAEQITLVGCIQKESDYRAAHDSGRGGTMGSGMGVGNEFVLINASRGSSTASAGETTGAATGTGTTGTGTTGTTASGTTASGTTAGTTSAGTAGTTGTMSGSPSMSSGGTAYALTGNKEKELEKFVGQRVEITGTLESKGGRSSGSSGGAYGTGSAGTGTSTSGTATGTTSGTTGGTMSGSAGASQPFSSLQEVNVVSFRAVGGSCSPQ